VTFGYRNAIEVLPHVEGEDQAILQQPDIGEARESSIVHGSVHALVQSSQKASGIGKDSYGGVILTVSSTQPA